MSLNKPGDGGSSVIDDVVKTLGGGESAAKICDVAPSQISKYKKRKRFPVDHVPHVLAALRAKGRIYQPGQLNPLLIDFELREAANDP